MQEVRYRLWIGALFLVLIAPSVSDNGWVLSIVLLTGAYSLVSGLIRWKIERHGGGRSVAYGASVGRNMKITGRRTRKMPRR